MTGLISVNEHNDVALVVISNEAKLNAMSHGMWSSLRRAVEGLGKIPTLRCIRIKGAGERAFSAGADISEFAETRTTREQVIRFHEEIVGTCLKVLLDCPVPLVAEIRGSCVGGGLEIASACDLRLADETARFGVPVGKLGFPLAFAETQALFDLVGPSTAAELLLEGRILSAEEAWRRGIVTRLSTSRLLASDVDAAISNICASGLWAARSHKHQLRRLARDRSPVTLPERMAVYDFADTDEYREGIRRFLIRKQVGTAG